MGKFFNFHENPLTKRLTRTGPKGELKVTPPI